MTSPNNLHINKYKPNMPNIRHVPVLLDSILESFQKHAIYFQSKQKNKNLIALDCTLGQGGHSYELIKLLNKGVLISTDLDELSINWVLNDIKKNHPELEIIKTLESGYIFAYKNKTGEISKTWFILNEAFANIEKIQQIVTNELNENELVKFNFILADLGFSNLQLYMKQGFSHANPQEDLDMRYNKSQKVKAKDILNNWDVNAHIDLFTSLGGLEKQSAVKLANKILQYKKTSPKKTGEPISKVGDLLKILNNFPNKDYLKNRIFYCLRASINNELAQLKDFLNDVSFVMDSRSVLNIVSFNDLEERTIKEKLNGNLNKKIIKEPNIDEIIRNPQSRSAKLHIYDTGLS